MSADFHPFRRDVNWALAHVAPIAPLLCKLDLTRDKTNWGYQLRFGLLPLSDHDFDLIAMAMRSSLYRDTDWPAQTPRKPQQAELF